MYVCRHNSNREPLKGGCFVLFSYGAGKTSTINTINATFQTGLAAVKMDPKATFHVIGSQHKSRKLKVSYTT